MTLPSILLGLVFSLLIGSLFHLWRDGGAGRLLLYLALSVFGFMAGQWLGSWRNWILFPVGPLNLGLDTLGSLVFLGFGYWLSLVEIRRSGDGEEAV